MCRSVSVRHRHNLNVTQAGDECEMEYDHGRSRVHWVRLLLQCYLVHNTINIRGWRLSMAQVETEAGVVLECVYVYTHAPLGMHCLECIISIARPYTCSSDGAPF